MLIKCNFSFAQKHMFMNYCRACNLCSSNTKHKLMMSSLKKKLFSVCPSQHLTIEVNLGRHCSMAH